MSPSELQLDFLKESFNIGVGRGTQVLNTMLNSHIQLTVPELRLINAMENVEFEEYEGAVATVNLQFNGALNGTCRLLLPSDSALKLVNQVMGTSDEIKETDFDAMSEGVLKEVGNIVLNSVIGVLGNTLEIQLVYSIPAFKSCDAKEIIDGLKRNDEQVGLMTRTHFNIESMDIHGDILTLFSLDSFSDLLSLIDKSIND
ncbi:MAG: chemotaxis protein CheC [Okeania sp. SIO3B3]|nr:chemotaxis protein CheC [Okeania sp. SIO3B3]